MLSIRVFMVDYGVLTTRYSGKTVGKPQHIVTNIIESESFEQDFVQFLYGFETV